MGYFVSVLRQRIANFEAKPLTVAVDGTLRRRRVAGRRSDRRLDQRSAQEPARPERVHGSGMPLGAGALWRGAGCVADHGNRSAAGGGVGAGGDQHGAQPGFERHQPGAGVGRSEDRAIQARGGDRDAEGAGGDGAAASCWRRNWRSCTAPVRPCSTPTCAMSG